MISNHAFCEIVKAVRVQNKYIGKIEDALGVILEDEIFDRIFDSDFFSFFFYFYILNNNQKEKKENAEEE